LLIFNDLIVLQNGIFQHGSKDQQRGLPGRWSGIARWSGHLGSSSARPAIEGRWNRAAFAAHPRLPETTPGGRGRRRRTALPPAELRIEG